MSFYRLDRFAFVPSVPTGGSLIASMPLVKDRTLLPPSMTLGTSAIVAKPVAEPESAPIPTGPTPQELADAELAAQQEKLRQAAADVDLVQATDLGAPKSKALLYVALGVGGLALVGGAFFFSKKSKKLGGHRGRRRGSRRRRR